MFASSGQAEHGPDSQVVGARTQMQRHDEDMRLPDFRAMAPLLLKFCEIVKACCQYRLHLSSAPELFSAFHSSRHMSQLQLPHPLSSCSFSGVFVNPSGRQMWGVTDTHKKGALLMQSQSSTSSKIGNLSLIQESRRGRSGMCFDSGEYVTETLLCRNNSFLQPYTQNLINSNTGNVGRPVVTLGDAHGYMGRLREEFEQQTSKLSRREITKAAQLIFQS